VPKGGHKIETSPATMHRAHVEYLANLKNPKQVFSRYAHLLHRLVSHHALAVQYFLKLKTLLTPVIVPTQTDPVILTHLCWSPFAVWITTFHWIHLLHPT